MTAWSHEFKFQDGDRVRIAIPESADPQWRSFDGRYGTVTKVDFQTQHPPYDPIFLRYRIELETKPRGKSNILWCREEFMVKAREKRDG